MLTERQIELVQKTWGMVKPIQHLAAGIFYTKLFTLDANLREYFLTGMDDQKRKLMSTLNIAINGLNDLERLVPVLKKLAIRHVDYGVTNNHFPLVGEALLHTLQTGLDDDFTNEVKEAWTLLYGIITDVMTTAMDEKREVLSILS